MIADAGGNALYTASARGKVGALTVFPNTTFLSQGQRSQYQAVPTAVVRAPDGSFSVGQLTGAPFLAGAANVYKVNRRTGARPIPSTDRCCESG